MPNDIDLLPETQVSAKYPSVTSLPWDKSAPWVAYNVWLHREDGARPETDAKSIRLVNDTGEVVVMSRSELEANYFAVDEGTSWKPRYAPVRALVMQDGGTFATPEGTEIKVNSGDAILFDGSRYMGLSADDYKSQYITVGFAGTLKPKTPFDVAASE
jgi:hypothetical protein